MVMDMGLEILLTALAVTNVANSVPKIFSNLKNSMKSIWSGYENEIGLSIQPTRSHLVIDEETIDKFYNHFMVKLQEDMRDLVEKQEISENDSRTTINVIKQTRDEVKAILSEKENGLQELLLRGLNALMALPDAWLSMKKEIHEKLTE